MGWPTEPAVGEIPVWNKNLGRREATKARQEAVKGREGRQAGLRGFCPGLGVKPAIYELKATWISPPPFFPWPQVPLPAPGFVPGSSGGRRGMDVYIRELHPDPWPQAPLTSGCSSWQPEHKSYICKGKGQTQKEAKRG